MRLLVSVLTALFLFSSAAEGQYTVFPQLKKYRSVSDYPVYTPDYLWDYINGAADAYLALGFMDLRINEYVKGKNSVKAEVYRFADDAQAFGIYSLERSPGYRFISTGVQGYTEEGVLNFYKGKYYVKIMTHSGSAKVNEMLTVLADKIAEGIDGSNEFPALLRSFPAEGLLKNQETFLLEGVLGHEYLRGAYRASYEVEGDRFDIYIFNTESPAEAASMAARLTDTPAGGSNDEIQKYVHKDGFNGLLYIVCKGDRLVVISGLESDKTLLADRYLNMILNR
ncbi:MAG: hypothetical protein IH593_09270 [Bacteroidales bacterium]|nr:hypothetical protein [Bacteroidales bacterium]